MCATMLGSSISNRPPLHKHQESSFEQQCLKTQIWIEKRAWLEDWAFMKNIDAQGY
jgi:hypothetical protein